MTTTNSAALDSIESVLRAAGVYAHEIMALESAGLTFDPVKLLATVVDDLGTVKAEIAALQEKEKALVAKLKLTGMNEINGTLFRATISDAERETVDTKALRADLGEDLIAPYIRTTSVSTCRVSARKTSK
jgi:hypothetical protein